MKQRCFDCLKVFTSKKTYMKCSKCEPRSKIEKDFASKCRIFNLPEPEREHKFYPGRQFRFDFSWPDKKLAVECEGAIWQRGGGAHSHPVGIERDMEKYNLATLMGWRVLRFTEKHIRSGEAIEMTMKLLEVVS